MINHQEYISENMRVSWIIAYYFLSLDPSIATLHFIQVCPGAPRTAWELSRNIYLVRMSESLSEVSRNSQILSGTPRCSQILTKSLLCPKGL